jgi:RecG-like helicase
MLSKPLAGVLRTTKKHLFKLEMLGIKSVRDFLLYFPRTYNDTSEYTKISEINKESSPVYSTSAQKQAKK